MRTIDPQRSGEGTGGAGWIETILADPDSIGARAMAARRLQLDPGASTPQGEHRDGERFLYVIGGTGTAIVGDERLPLAPESVLWLESGDRYRVEAGPDGIELLLAEAPGR
jgi:quercetin dioxygenase-like cupin family protein